MGQAGETFWSTIKPNSLEILLSKYPPAISGFGLFKSPEKTENVLSH